MSTRFKVYLLEEDYIQFLERTNFCKCKNIFCLYTTHFLSEILPNDSREYSLAVLTEDELIKIKSKIKQEKTNFICSQCGNSTEIHIQNCGRPSDEGYKTYKLCSC